ncbi:YccF domain-containing protein [Mycoplasmatota bacterium WC44]
MSFIGNLIWLLFGGIISFIGWFLVGVVLCVTIIGIPFGVQCLKISRLVLWPFGSEVEVGSFGVGGLLGNIIWILLVGWELCILHLVVGVLLTITIIGIPFGRQHFKFALLALLPFGAKIK